VDAKGSFFREVKGILDRSCREVKVEVEVEVEAA
jgi:hypothetical protein